MADALALAQTMGAEALQLSTLQQRARVQLAAGMLADAQASLDATEPLTQARRDAQAAALAVLKAAHDPRQSALAQRAPGTPLARAERIPDAQARASYLAMAEHQQLP